ncbi:response regulator transcription factor [Clostridium polynesiense]|uniref:response regulator transcription factor n=1 Tax=Clostridium polynesiense TaxID=1325933 RepID=UPI00058BDFF2|nr:response regulator [Clostridium polynesiense]
MYKVIIVEDEEILRKGLLFMVDWTKVNCIVAGEASNGIEGLELIKEVKPDIVITDVKMPFKDGLRMLEESMEEFCYETIVLSGYGEFEYAKKAITLNVTEYLLKPINFDLLYNAIVKIEDKIDKKQRIQGYVQLLNDNLLYNKLLDMSYYKTENIKNKYVSKMINYIKENYSNKISLTDLSLEYNLSYVYLNTKFKEGTGYTFNDFLNRYRILQSIRLLKENNMRVYEIAEVVGFQDYKYFIQVFKKYIGCSPIKFMNSHVSN